MGYDMGIPCNIAYWRVNLSLLFLPATWWMLYVYLYDNNMYVYCEGLHRCLEQHIPQFEAHCIRGSDLLKLSQQQLEYLKVSQVESLLHLIRIEHRGFWIRTTSLQRTTTIVLMHFKLPLGEWLWSLLGFKGGCLVLRLFVVLPQGFRCWRF